MKTDDLLARLAAEAPVRAMNPAAMAAMAATGAAAVCALFLAVAGVRGNLGAALADPLVVAKSVWPALVAALALPLAMGQARPDAGRGRLALIALPVLLGAVLWGLGFAARSPEARFAESTPGAVVECLGLILILSVVPVALALRVLRQGATLTPRLTGALAGLGAAAGAATGYSLFCVQDNPVFYVTWYGAAMVVAAGAGAVIGGRFLRW